VVAPLYNGFALAVVTAWFVLSIGPDVSGPGGVFLHGLVESQALVQTINVSFLAFLSPVFLFPPLVTLPGRWSDPRPRPVSPPPSLRRRWGRRVVRAGSFGLSAGILYLSAAMALWTPLTFSVVGGFDALPGGYTSGYGHDPTASFAVVGAVLSDVTAPPADWSVAIPREVALAKELGVRYLRYDIQTELLSNPSGPAALSDAVQTARAAGVGIILSPFGSQAWGSVHPSLAALNATIQNETAELVGGYHPDWIFPFFEPNGQLQIDLGHAEPTATWVGMVAEAAATAKRLDPSVQVLVEVADSSQGLSLASAMAALPSVNAVGFDLYPTAVSDLGHTTAYAQAVHAEGHTQFWISETGVNSLLFGEIAQARVLGQEVRDAFTQWNASGFCVWGLQDNVGEGLGPHLLNSLGLVAFDGRIKPSFGVYQYAIAATRG
jgi:hypothetical protein